MAFSIEKSPVPTSFPKSVVDKEMGDMIDLKVADIALAYLAHEDRLQYTEEEERAVRWKIDLCLLPIASQTTQARDPPANQL